MALAPGDVPHLNAQFDSGGSALSAQDYFVLTRIDGRTSVRELCLISGLGGPETLAILGRLHDAGAILLGGETPRVAAPPIGPPPAREASASAVPAAPEGELDLSEEQKRAILRKHASLATASPFEVLEIEPTNDKRAIKRAYFKVSKDFHPDRYYGKRLGPFRERLDAVFKAVTDAFDAAAAAASTGGSPAAELFDRACQRQALGELPGALEDFAAALRLDPQARYLRRAADAAMVAGRLSEALEYATKAAEIDPRDAVAHRTLGKVFRAQGRLVEARRELELASRLDPESVHIAADLDEVTKLLGTGQS